MYPNDIPPLKKSTYNKDTEKAYRGISLVACRPEIFDFSPFSDAKECEAFNRASGYEKAHWDELHPKKSLFKRFREWLNK